MTVLALTLSQLLFELCHPENATNHAPASLRTMLQSKVMIEALAQLRKGAVVV